MYIYSTDYELYILRNSSIYDLEHLLLSRLKVKKKQPRLDLF